jgi:speckle-type POZ protein
LSSAGPLVVIFNKFVFEIFCYSTLIFGESTEYFILLTKLELINAFHVITSFVRYVIMTSETIVPKMIVPYEWILENVGKGLMTIASKMILFRGEKVFRVGLKHRTAFSPILFFMAIDLNKIGMNLEDVKFRIQVSGLDPATMMEMTREDIGNEGSLQLFTATLNEKVLGNCKIMFRICIGGTDPGYSFQLCDRLAKDQLWAALKNQQKLADVVFIVKDKTFPAHKAILAARSPVFADEFEKVQPVNGVRLQIRIDDVEPSTVEKFLHFIYTGEPMGTLADEELLNLADHVQLKTLSGLCKHALKKMDAMQMEKVRQRLDGNAKKLSDSKIM